ncbi:MAG TPA: hypothetical protein VMW73_08570 [Spirochaetia bacterium]|nr:hypothetical protein [Spirochaetia bacterium]
MRVYALRAAVLAVLAFASCSGEGRVATTPPSGRDQAGVTVEIIIKTGPKWSHTYRVAGLPPAERTGTGVFSAESAGTIYMGTTYITEKFGAQGSDPAATVPEETVRIEAVPVWFRHSTGPEAVFNTGPENREFRIHATLPASRPMVRVNLEVGIPYVGRGGSPGSGTAATFRPAITFTGLVDGTEPGSYPLRPAANAQSPKGDSAVYGDGVQAQSVVNLIESCVVVVP